MRKTVRIIAGALLSIMSGALAAAKLIADWVGRSTFVEDAEALGPKAAKMFEWLTDQPAVAFYVVPLILAAVGAAMLFLPARRTAQLPAEPPKAEKAERLPKGQPSPAQSIPPAQTSSGRYFAADDKERISRAFSELADILNKPATKLYEDKERIFRHWERLKPSRGREEEIKMVISQIEALRPIATEIEQRLNKLFQNYPRHVDILQSVIQLPVVRREQPISRLEDASNDMHDMLTTFVRLSAVDDERTREGLRKMANPTESIFQAAIANLNGWIFESNRRMRELEAVVFK